jgi:hypothetical protein
MLRGILTIGGWTMASRVLGFMRDVILADLLGAGPVADAFFVATRLPNLFPPSSPPSGACPPPPGPRRLRSSRRKRSP